MPLPNDAFLDARMRRLLDGPVGRSFRFLFALLFAGVFGAMIAAAAAPVLVPRLPVVASLVCPPGHRIAVASWSEIDPDGRAPRGRSRQDSFACSDDDGRAVADTRPHFAILRTAWFLTMLALFPLMTRMSEFLLRPRESRHRP